MRRWPLALTCLLFGACGIRPAEPPTLGSLPTRMESAAPERPVQGGAERAMDTYERVLEEAPPSEMRAEAMRRLADLRQEHSEGRVAEGDRPAPGTQTAIIALYEQRLREYPDHPHNDRVLYQLARAYEHEQQREASQDALTRLAQQYPESPLLAEAHFRRGETLFVDRDYPSAGDAYQAVLALGDDTGFYEHALYKLGWSLFRQQRHEDSVDVLLVLLDRKAVDGRTEPERLAGGERERIEDTLRAVSLNFSYLGGPEAVTAYFRERGHRDDEDVIYARLAEEYMEKERYSDAAASFGAFVQAHPTRAEAPAMQLRVIETYRQGGFSSEVLAAKQEFAGRFDLHGPFWSDRSPAEHPEVVAALAQNITRLAQHHHARFQEDKSDAGHFAGAEHWYRRYLANFPDTDATQEMHFLYAELLFEAERFADAAREYEQAAYLYAPDERAAEAGYAALLAYDAHARTLDERGDARLRWERASLQSAGRFTEAFPEHPEAVGVLAHAMDRLFTLGDTREAALAATRLLERYPDAQPTQQLGAWVVIGHVAFDDGDYLHAERAYQQALASPVLEAERRPDMADRLAASVFRQAEVARDAGETDQAVVHFLRVPEGRFHASAQYDAAELLLAREDWTQAAQVLEGFRTRYPEHPLRLDATRKLAMAYGSAGQPARAAGEYLRIASASDDPAEQREGLLLAADLYRDAGDRGREVAVLGDYVERFPSPLDPAMDARQRLLEAHLASNDANQVRRWREAIIRADAQAGSARTERSRFLAGTASMALAEETLEAYRAVRLVEPLDRNLQRKRRLMEQSLEAFGRAGEYRIAEVTTAATFYTAEIYADFGRALMASERPRGLDELALEEYEILLEEQAFPFEEKAIELFEVNTARTSQGLYDQWIRKSFEQLALLLPVRYAKQERRESLVETLR